MKTYYYAGGTKVELQDDTEHVAVDRSAAPGELMKSLSGSFTGAPQQAGGVLIAPKASISAEQLASLKRAGALRPVFRRDRAMLVPLPEVRVELDNVEQRESVAKVLADAGDKMLIAEEASDRLVLKPASGSSTDALNMANEIYERARPAASSVRFLQFVPRPHPKTKG